MDVKHAENGSFQIKSQLQIKTPLVMRESWQVPQSVSLGEGRIYVPAGKYFL